MCDKISRQFWGEVLLGPSRYINYLRWQVSYHGNAIIVSTIVLAGPQLAFLLEWSIISLRSAAAMVLTNLYPSQWRSYEVLTATLDSCFGMAHQMGLNRSRLKARSRRREETLAELAEDVEWLVHLAYPEAAESMVEVLAKEQFVDALPDEDMRYVSSRTCLLRWEMH